MSGLRQETLDEGNQQEALVEVNIDERPAEPDDTLPRRFDQRLLGKRRQSGVL
jgi:hypothetical protein